MKFARRWGLLLTMLGVLVRLNASGATDPDVERLLKKLPAPDKLVHADERVLRMNDPAIHDPLVKQVVEASKAKQLKRALELSEQLAKRYPSSVLANCFTGYFYLVQHRYGDSAGAFRRALKIQPQFVVAHYYLGLAEWRRQHFDAALQQFRDITMLEPKVAGGWAVLSIAAEGAGFPEESVKAAKHLVELAPQQSAAWVRLAMAEYSAGNSAGAKQAWNKAVALRHTAKHPGKTGEKKAHPIND
jgi:tetratricopeptide (TPR) repeat protein